MTKLIVEDDSIPYGLVKLARRVRDDALRSHPLDWRNRIKQVLPLALQRSPYRDQYFVYTGGHHVAILTNATTSAVAARVILITE